MFLDAPVEPCGKKTQSVAAIGSVAEHKRTSHGAVHGLFYAWPDGQRRDHIVQLPTVVFQLAAVARDKKEEHRRT